MLIVQGCKRVPILKDFKSSFSTDQRHSSHILVDQVQLMHLSDLIHVHFTTLYS